MPRKLSLQSTASKEEPTRRVLVHLPDSVHHRVKVVAAERRTTMDRVIREAVERAVMRAVA